MQTQIFQMKDQKTTDDSRKYKKNWHQTEIIFFDVVLKPSKRVALLKKICGFIPAV